MSDLWPKLEGRIVNSVFPLHRYLGGSEHSGVFLTDTTAREPSQVALKLMRAVPTVAETQLSRWLTAASLHHPHLIRIFEAGRCQLDGLHYLYAVMEYADQNLAQLLERRALMDDEAREMLAPTLDALAFLHKRKLVQGRLKPSNVLVVGDQLKLASDTIRSIGEVTDSIKVMPPYEPPEARDGSCSTAGDIWALGVALTEALTRRQPSGLDDHRGGIVLPADLSPAFRDIVAWCLARRPDDRPEVAQLEAWIRGEHTGPAVASRGTAPDVVVSESATSSAQPPPHRQVVNPGSSAQPPSRRNAIPVTFGALAAVGLIWAGMAVVTTDPEPTPPAAEAPREPLLETPASLPTSSEVASTASDPPVAVPVASLSNTGSAEVEAADVEAAEVETPAASSGINEVIPEVPRSASRTIRGHVRVSVRVIVDNDGTVFAALSDDPGPSRYFERLALDAAKKWTFPPTDTEAQRLVLLRFDFTRENTTARAIPLQ